MKYRQMYSNVYIVKYKSSIALKLISYVNPFSRNKSPEQHFGLVLVLKKITSQKIDCLKIALALENQFNRTISCLILFCAFDIGSLPYIPLLKLASSQSSGLCSVCFTFFLKLLNSTLLISQVILLSVIL